MTPRAPFDPGSRHLPPDLPIFPLQGLLLLPRGRLPLNIFEPRYLAMTEDALRADRLIGMIQPSGPGEPPPVYAIGCAGRIVSFDETEDGRYHLTLCGISRFTVLQEFQTPRGYRRAQVDWSGIKDDFDEDSCPHFDRAGFITLLQAYFGRQGLSANWDAIAETPRRAPADIAGDDLPVRRLRETGAAGSPRPRRPRRHHAQAAGNGGLRRSRRGQGPALT